MNAYDASEQAYKRGYEQGKKDARKKGRWIPVATYEVCSHCGFEINRGERIREFFLVDNQYCCWCGADMRGEEDGKE